MTEDKVMEIMQIARARFLRDSIGEEDDSNLGDFVADNNGDPEGMWSPDAARAHRCAAGRFEGERQVIVLRFGLEDGHPRTLEEVGKEFNVTRSASARSRQRPCATAIRCCSKRIRDFL